MGEPPTRNRDHGEQADGIETQICVDQLERIEDAGHGDHEHSGDDPGIAGWRCGKLRSDGWVYLGGRSGQVTMKAGPPESPVIEGLHSLEVRWIFPGRLENAVAEWFGRFPARVEAREDVYLYPVDPRSSGLSVKVRGAGHWM